MLDLCLNISHVDSGAKSLLRLTLFCIHVYIVVVYILFYKNNTMSILCKVAMFLQMQKV